MKKSAANPQHKTLDLYDSKMQKQFQGIEKKEKPDQDKSQDPCKYFFYNGQNQEKGLWSTEKALTFMHPHVLTALQQDANTCMVAGMSVTDMKNDNLNRFKTGYGLGFPALPFAGFSLVTPVACLEVVRGHE